MTRKRRTSILLLLPVVALIAGVVLSGCGNGLPGDALAKVGQTLITEEQLDARIQQLADQYQMEIPDKDSEPEAYKSFQRTAIQTMVDVEVAKQKAAELGVTVSEEDIQKQIDQIKQMVGGDEAAFEQAVAAQGLTVDRLKEDISEGLYYSRVMDAVTKDLQVSDEEIKVYYEANKDSYKVEETRKARIILFKPKAVGATEPAADPTDADWAAAKALAEKVRAEIKDGADFAAEAKTYSDDPATKEIGGDLGEVPRGQWPEEFDTVLFSLKEGEISEPVKTIYGYHLIQVLEINEAKQYTLEEKTDQIKSTLLNQKQGVAWREWLDKTQAELGVVYADGLEPTTTTTESTSTTEPAGSTTSAPGSTSSTSE